MATTETASEIVTLASEVAERDIDEVIRDVKWGEYNFDDCRNDLEAAFAAIPEFGYRRCSEQPKSGDFGYRGLQCAA